MCETTLLKSVIGSHALDHFLDALLELGCESTMNDTGDVSTEIL
jgi:hypothetical protein